MRRLRTDETGATAMVVALLLFALLGMAAFVVDLGDGMWERRMLQNSSDAAALAVAIDCAQGDCEDYDTTARDYADENNRRGAFVTEVVGPDGGPPATAGGEVTVTNVTGDRTDPGRLRQWFSGALGQDEGLATTASATAIWGAIGLADATIPLTISMCDWEDALGISFDVENLANNDLSNLPTVAELPSGPYYGKTKGVTLQFHDPQGPGGDCSAKPGHDGDNDGKLPAGWGWLTEADTACEVKNISAEEDGSFWAEKRPSVTSPTGISCLQDALGTAVILPVFIDFRRANPNDQYRLYAPAAFYLTGYRFPGHNAPSTALRPCNSPDTCISGHFVTRTAAGSPGGDIDLGVRAVQLSR
jgi:hypothetical protein